MPTFRQVPRLRLAMSSVARACDTERVTAELVVVDDADDAETASAVRELAQQHRELSVVLVQEGHGGRSVSRNRGARAARGERLLFLDGDVLLAPGCLRAHQARASGQGATITRGGIRRMPWLAAFADPLAGTLTERARASLGSFAPEGLASRRVRLGADGYLASDVTRLSRENQFERDIVAHLDSSAARGRWLGVTGAHLSMPRARFLELGGFDEEMGRRWGAEDLELGFRAERAGWQIERLREASVFHMDHDTSGRQGDHANALGYFARKHDAPGVLRLLQYFSGECSFAEVAGSC
ncbi:MAG TPA: glycosyltransferase family 2 protein [Polyangiaceae bacterium]|nr:glycosyltransferase family 2 protein [Polyangiaceae bacterium]